MHTVSVVISDGDSRILKISPRGGDAEHYFWVEAAALERLHGSGVTPELVSIREDDAFLAMRLVRHTPLMDWLVGRSADERVEMRARLLDQLVKLHELGMCHRDLQLNNIVVGEQDIPLFVDLELATEHGGAIGSYDVFGPCTGVAIPDVHPDIGLPDGIWWNAPWHGVEVPLLALAFGPLRPEDVPARLRPPQP